MAEPVPLREDGAVARAATTHRVESLVIALLVIVGTVLRLIPALNAGFPVGDGGMFFVMVKALLAHHLRRPDYVTYNTLHIPFAYPPLGFYVLAILHLWAGASVLDLMRIVPAIFTVGALCAFAWLAVLLLPGRVAAVGAVAAFALMPDTFAWQIQGGGITRAPGQFFALLMLALLTAALLRRRIHFAWLAGLAGALAVMSHPEWAWFAAYSAVVVLVFLGRTMFGLKCALIVACVAAAVSSVWWLGVVFTVGPGTYTAMLSNTGRAYPPLTGLYPVLNLMLTNEPGFAVWEAAALAGVLICIVRGRWLLPAWLLVLLAVDARGPISRSIVVFALLIGVAASTLVQRINPTTAAKLHVPRLSARVLALTLGLLLGRQLLLSGIEVRQITPLSQSTLEAMSWVHVHTPTTARFAVITGLLWAQDDVAEWFPALTGRSSVSTVQGTEWVRGVFPRRIQANSELQSCAVRTPSCLAHWFRSAHMTAGYVWVVKGASTGPSPDCCLTMRALLDSNSAYRKIYSNRSAVIYRRTTP